MFGVLGPLQIGERTPRSGAQRVIAAALALDAGTVVTSDRLIELIWGDGQPVDATAALQSHVSRLRRVLPRGAAIVAEGDGYLLRLPADMIDAVSFEADHRRAATAGDDAGRLQATERALARWRGVPYPDLDDDRSTAERVRLLERRDELIGLRAEALVRLGRAAEAVAELEASRIADPLREHSVEWLMRAYASSGRTTDALAAYTDFRATLIDQTGLDPSRALGELERAILTGESVGPPQASGQRAGRPTPQIVLPASTFVGRDREVSALADVIRQSRIVSLIGPGGVGKTRLALHLALAVADGFHGDVDIVALASLRNGDDLAESVATAMSLQPGANLTATERIIDALGSRSRLIVLDNCEHLIADAAQFVDDVVRQAPGVTFLTTSREFLNVDGEYVYRVEPLATDDVAIELFADRAFGWPGSGLVIDEANRAAVKRICESVDGLPLAIELAAAHTASMTVEQIAAGVEDPLQMLDRGRRTSDERHRSLRELVHWSVRDLDETLLGVFAGTAAFAGPFSAAALARVIDRPLDEVGAGLTGLVDRSLVVVDRSSRSEALFSTLETIRAYAAELLDESGAAEAIRDRHSDWAIDLVRGHSTALGCWAEAEASGAVATHLADLRLAHRRFLTTDDADRALRLAADLHFAAYYPMHAEIFGWITETATRFGTTGHEQAESVLASASTGSWLAGDLEAAAHFASMAASLPSPGPGAGRGAAETASDILRFAGDNAGARRELTTAIAIARTEGNLPRLINDLADLAIVAGYLGDVEASRAACDEARELVGADGPRACRAWVDYAEAEAIANHDPAAATALLDRSIELAEQSGAAFIVGVARLTRTSVLMRSGDARAAVPGIVQLIEHWRQRGARLQQWITLRSVVDLFVRLDRFEDAAAVLGAVLASSEADVRGADGERLAAAKATVLDRVPDAERILASWARRSQDVVVDYAIDRLGDAMAQPSE